MQKEELNIEGLYQIKKEDLKRCAEVGAQAFINDESSKYLLASKLSYESLYNFYSVIFKALYNKMYLFAESENIDGFIIVAPMGNSVLGILDFIKAGGLKIIFSQGIEIMLRAIKYEGNCIKIRSKIIPPNTWHLFQFGVLPAKQGMGLGSKTIKPFLKFLDSKKAPCYLETQNATNVEIYKHFGFVLKSTDTLPNNGKKQFAMLR